MNEENYGTPFDSSEEISSDPPAVPLFNPPGATEEVRHLYDLLRTLTDARYGYQVLEKINDDLDAPQEMIDRAVKEVVRESPSRRLKEAYEAAYGSIDTIE